MRRLQAAWVVPAEEVTLAAASRASQRSFVSRARRLCWLRAPPFQWTSPRPVCSSRARWALSEVHASALDDLPCRRSARARISPTVHACSSLSIHPQAGFTGTKFGFGGMAMNIWKTEGLGGLYAGVTPAVARHVPYTGFRAIGYEYIRALFCGSKPPSEAPLIAKMAAGMSAGAIGQAIAVPCDLIKVRMQSDGRLVAAGKLSEPRYVGLMDAFNKIKAAEGVGGFYAGCTPAIQRAALVNLGELTTYDTAKQNIKPITGDNLLCHLCSAICSGCVHTCGPAPVLCTHPHAPGAHPSRRPYLLFLPHVTSHASHTASAGTASSPPCALHLRTWPSRAL